MKALASTVVALWIVSQGYAAAAEPSQTQTKAAEMAIIAMWKDLANNWIDQAPVLCLSVRLGGEQSAHAHRNELSMQSLLAIQTVVGVGVKVRLLSDCELKRTVYGLATPNDEPAWTLEYTDADVVIAENQIEPKRKQASWADRDEFNINRMIELSPESARIQPHIDAFGRLQFDGQGIASKGQRTKVFWFDFKSSVGNLAIASQEGYELVQ